VNNEATYVVPDSDTLLSVKASTMLNQPPGIQKLNLSLV